jgi:hypothetical protein
MNGNNTNRGVVIVNVFHGLGSLKVFTRSSSNILTVARHLECSVISIMIIIHPFLSSWYICCSWLDDIERHEQGCCEITIAMEVPKIWITVKVKTVFFLIVIIANDC